MPGPSCQDCGGEIQGWICQGCGATFTEVGGALIKAHDDREKAKLLNLAARVADEDASEALRLLIEKVFP